VAQHLAAQTDFCGPRRDHASIDDNCGLRTNGRLFVIVLLGAFARYLLTEPRTC
jgi:hypothetical protein